MDQYIFQLIFKSLYLRMAGKKVVGPVIQRNVFFAHPKDFVLAMLHDDRNDIRDLGMYARY